MWFPNTSDINQAVQSQKMARGLNFRILKVEVLYYPCSENKGAGITAKLVCVFDFAYTDCWFSHEVAQCIIKDFAFKQKLKLQSHCHVSRPTFYYVSET